MPVPTPLKTQQREALRGFLGVNLRRDRLHLEDQALAGAINADLHTRPGVLMLRRGRRQQFSTPLSDLDIRRLAFHGGQRYQIAGRTWYRNQVPILTDLAAAMGVTTLHPFRPLNDTALWVFLGDDAVMRKEHDGVVRNWGITAPTVAPVTAVGGAGVLVGTYNAVYTYARIVDTKLVHESNPSPEGQAQLLNNNTMTVLVTASPDPQVTHIRLYRTLANGTEFFADQQFPNFTATETTSQPDSSLDRAVERDNDVPVTLEWITEFQGHMWGCRDTINPHYLWYSKRFRPEAFPSGQFLELGNPDDPLQCAVSLTGMLGVFSRDTKYRVFGNITSGFTYLEALSSRGTPAPNAVLTTSVGAFFPARSGIYLTNFVQEDVELSQAIEPLFYGQEVNDFAPIDWARAQEMASAEYKGRFYWSYVDTAGDRIMAVFSKDTRQWFFYDHPARSLLYEESTDHLTMGCLDGLVYIIEAAQETADDGNAIRFSAQPAQRALADDGVRKLFQYVRADIDARNGVVTLTVFIDDRMRASLVVRGSRQRTLLRLPGSLMGYTWHIDVAYEGTEAIAVYGLQMLAIPMEPS